MITWEGFYNTRDLGGLPTLDGGRTRHGAYLRSADPRFVTGDGWRTAQQAGVRTIVDLRNPGEGEPATRPGIQRVQIPIDDIDDEEFWREVGELTCCPLYYPLFLERKAKQCAAAITVLARAEPGVVFHCKGGRDRTGLIAILLLSVAGAAPAAIADDYLRSTDALTPLFARLGEPDHRPLVEAIVAKRGTTLRAAVEATLDGFDAERYLLDAGVAAADLATVRARLCSDNGSPTPR